MPRFSLREWQCALFHGDQVNKLLKLDNSVTALILYLCMDQSVQPFTCSGGCSSALNQHVTLVKCRPSTTLPPRATVPKIFLDDVFTTKDEIALGEH